MVRGMTRLVVVLFFWANVYGASDKETVVSVMCWYSPLGSMNGVKNWQVGGYQYERNRSGESKANYPAASGLKLPPALVIGSEEYRALQAEAAKLELDNIKRGGFDVAVFDMLPWPAYDPSAPLSISNVPFNEFQTFLSWLQAGEAVGVKVGLSPDVQNRSGDYPKGYKLNADEWTRNLAGAYDQIKDYPALWRIEGRPAAIHFGTSILAGNAPPVPGDPDPDGGWRKVLANLKAQGKNYYFVADIRPLDKNIEAWDKIADAVYSFAPAGPKNYFAEIHPILEKKFSIPFLWTLSPGYFAPAVKSYTEPDFERIHKTYLAAIKSGTKRMVFLTWNDFGEDTDIAPSANKGNCLLDVVAYYNAWFKSGKLPDIAAEKIIVSYPVFIPENITFKTPVWGEPKKNQERYEVSEAVLKENPNWGDWAAPAYKPKVFYWALSKTKKVLEIPGAGKVELPVGLSFGELGLAKAGPMSATLAGKTIELPPVLAAVDDRDVGLRFRYVNLSEPLPPLTKEALALKPLHRNVSENFEGGEKSLEHYKIAGTNLFLVAENPFKDKVNGSSKCLHLIAVPGADKSQFFVELMTVPVGKFRFKIYSSLPYKAGPPYGQSVWSFRSGASVLFGGDFLEYLGEARASYGESEPFGGVKLSRLGKIGEGWHEVSGSWTRDGRVSLSFDGAECVQGKSMMAAMSTGVTSFQFASTGAGDGKRSADVYLDDLVVERGE